jgi:polar amino acid transport system substrate-binding protein
MGKLASFRRVGALLGVIALTVTATACVKQSSGTTGTDGVNLVSAGKLTVCTHLPYPPFQSRDKTGKVVGFDVDMVDLVATKLKLTQTIVDTPFEGIKSGEDLKTGKCDVAAAGMTINPARQAVMDFTIPYFDATQALLVAPGTPYKSLASLKGKSIGAESATTGLDYIKKNAAANGYTAVDLRDFSALTQALQTHQIDGIVADLPVVAVFARENPAKGTVTAQFNTGEQYGFSVKKGGNAKLLALLNTAITTSKKDGTYAKLYQKWIGTPPPADAK